jgi:hypothetical protein
MFVLGIVLAVKCIGIFTPRPLPLRTETYFRISICTSRRLSRNKDASPLTHIVMLLGLRHLRCKCIVVIQPDPSLLTHFTQVVISSSRVAAARGAEVYTQLPFLAASVTVPTCI